MTKVTIGELRESDGAAQIVCTAIRVIMGAPLK